MYDSGMDTSSIAAWWNRGAENDGSPFPDVLLFFLHQVPASLSIQISSSRLSYGRGH